MGFTLQQLSDLEEIKQLKHAYFRCIDTANEDELVHLLAEDISIEYRGGSYTAKLKGRGNMIDFISSAFNSDVIAMHHGHGPEIKFTGENTAEGKWYLQDIFINPERKTNTVGASLYSDKYVRESTGWKIAQSQYDRIYEMVLPIENMDQVTFSYLKKHGRQLEDRIDISQWLEFHS